MSANATPDPRSDRGDPGETEPEEQHAGEPDLRPGPQASDHLEEVVSDTGPWKRVTSDVRHGNELIVALIDRRDSFPQALQSSNALPHNATP
ncbi:unnamed protein product [Lota lota]